MLDRADYLAIIGEDQLTRFKDAHSDVSESDLKSIPEMRDLYLDLFKDSGLDQKLLSGQVKRVAAVIPGASAHEIIGMKFAIETLGGEVDFLWYDAGGEPAGTYVGQLARINGDTSIRNGFNNGSFSTTFEGSRINFRQVNAADSSLWQEADAIKPDGVVFFAGNTGPFEFGGDASWHSVLTNWARYIAAKNKPALFVETSTYYDTRNVTTIFNSVVDNAHYGLTRLPSYSDRRGTSNHHSLTHPNNVGFTHSRVFAAIRG